MLFVSMNGFWKLVIMKLQSCNEKGATSMRRHFFDYEDGDCAFSISGNMAMDSDGDLMMRMGDHMAMDMDSGEIHMVSSWPDDADDN